ncbi:hypothetical protein MalM25_03220 [Planctomycetes bacterium MalM25]|nr:hypothetical protein MalM25_03220 [Planctomycetes bacterium MalM25]
MIRSLMLAALLAASFTLSADAQTRLATVRQGEAAVRELPIHERPNRFGHFYGNTVRRRHHGTLFVNRMHSDRPLARFFYAPR